MNIDKSFLENLGLINIFLGKNGSGKSTLFRKVRDYLNSNSGEYGYFQYISPERGGFLSYDSGIDQNISSNPRYTDQLRKYNYSENFKKQTVSTLNSYKSLLGLKIEKFLDENSENKGGDLIIKGGVEGLSKYKFDVYTELLSGLLDNISIKFNPQSKFYDFSNKENGTPITIQSISSGESELLTMGIEIINFFLFSYDDKLNILLLDEPDVHLHPDLQVRLTIFINKLFLLFVEKENFIKILLSTHSTSLVYGIDLLKKDTKIIFMKNKLEDLRIDTISNIYKDILPIFGAHPLTNIFSEKPILILEGQDDFWVFQQAIKTSEGKIKVYPCDVGGKQYINDYEIIAKKIINSIYDGGKVYSLRDGDGISDTISDDDFIIKFRLNCYAIENLIFTNEVLNNTEVKNWDNLKNLIEKWLEKNEEHIKYQELLKFKDSGYNRKETKIKDIMNILVGIITTKPWEVLIGQVIGKLSWDDNTDFITEGSIYNYLGEKIIKEIIPKNK